MPSSDQGQALVDAASKDDLSLLFPLKKSTRVSPRKFLASSTCKETQTPPSVISECWLAEPS